MREGGPCGSAGAALSSSGELTRLVVGGAAQGVFRVDPDLVEQGGSLGGSEQAR